MNRLTFIPYLVAALFLAACGSFDKDRPGSVFRDCPECPEMVVIPKGDFRMGDLSGDGRYDELPVHRVHIGYRLAVGRFEVTNEEWNACVAVRGCLTYVADDGFLREKHPVVNVSWNNAQAYLRWLSARTGKKYRLLSESEWEYAARGDTGTKYHFGDRLEDFHANYKKLFNRTTPVGNYQPNAFGLYDMHGNAFEWTQDCYQDSYNGVPTNGTANKGPNPCRRVVRGGDWGTSADAVRAARRIGFDPNYRFNGNGFRVARRLP